MRITATKSDFGRRINIRIMDLVKDPSKGFGKWKGVHVEELTFVDYGEGVDVAPSCYLDLDKAQALMDNLWDCGIRPTEGSGSAGSMSATQKHLQDMRTIVEKQLKVGFK